MKLRLPVISALIAITLPALAAAPRLTWFPTPHSPQLANYDISVTLDPLQHSLTKGRETIRWKNGTANPTAQLKFHLYQNAFASNRTDFMSESGVEMRGIKHNGDESVDFGYEEVTALSVTFPGGSKLDLTKEMILGGPAQDGEKLDDTVMTVPLPQPGLQRERVLVAGDVPSPSHPPSGCHFHTRCPHARALCAGQAPDLEMHDGHAVACHFWREIVAPKALPRFSSHTAARERLEQLQSAFVDKTSAVIAPAP